MTTIANFALRYEWTSGYWTLMVSLVEVIGNDQFLNSFNVRDLKCKEILEWLHHAAILPNPEIAQVKTDKVARWAGGKSGIAHKVSTSMFREYNGLVLQELCTEQIHVIIRVSVAAQKYGLKDKWIFIMFLKLVQGNQCAVEYLHAECTCNASCRLPNDKEASSEDSRCPTHRKFCSSLGPLICQNHWFTEERESRAQCRCADWDYNRNHKVNECEALQCIMPPSLTSATVHPSCAVHYI